MHPRTTELLRYIDEQAGELRAAFESVPDSHRDVSPAPGRWSAAQVVHHVVIVERLVAQRVRGLIEQAKSLQPEHDASSILEILQPHRMTLRTRRIVTSSGAEPRETNAAGVWTDFEETRRTFNAVVASGDGLQLGAVSAPHPALGELSGYGWIAFAGAHAARHAAQIREDGRST
ncbi:MAG: DinB family protein [Gemmatimonadaceae bacterium]